MEMNGNTIRVSLPSGNWAVIREQNGEDDDVLSNIASRDLSNFAEFISRIVLESSYAGKLTTSMAKKLPVNDKYAIMMASRIHSIGPDVEFNYTWPDNQTIAYSQDLSELLFDYDKAPTEEDLKTKPYAIPYYPNGAETVMNAILPSGKEITYEILTGEGEAFILQLPIEKRTKNADLLARKLMLKIDGKFEKVENFALFTKKDMIALRKHVAENDPAYAGLIDIQNPETGETALFSIMGTPDFFYPGGL